MGLDIYLYQRKNWQTELKEDADYEWTGEQEVEIDSSLHPEHMFKVGYFRSSYNEGGINSVLERAGLPTLYDIFDYPHDGSYLFGPDWVASLERVKDAIRSVKDYAQSDDGQYDVMALDTIFCSDNSISSKSDAMKAFISEKNSENKSGWRSYSNRLGEFYFDGLECVGFIQGMSFRMPAIYAIYKRGDGNLDWYIEAYQIVQETIEYVLAQPNPEDFYFHWSG